MKFNNPQDFLKYLKKVWKRDLKPLNHELSKQWEEEFTKISNKRREEYGEIDKIPKGMHHEFVVQEILKDLKKVLAQSEVEQLESKIAFGFIETGEINAVCTIDDNNNYAIVVNSGLLTYLHKFGKFLTALSSPELVTYCNRKEAKSLTREDIIGYVEELPQIFMKLGQPSGPLIHLDQKGMAVHSLSLNIAESFVIGHEIGHFFKGHLNDSSNLVPFLSFFQKLKNDNHAIEFEADDFSLKVLRAKVERMGVNEHVVPTIQLGLSHLFNAIASLNPYSSESHPSPMDRMNRLFEKLKVEKEA